MKVQLTKANQSLFFFVLLTIVLYYGKPILIPFSFAVLLAMLMAPLCQRLDNKGFRRAVSCLICVFILLLVFLGMMAITVGQVSEFTRDVSLLEQKTNELLVSLHIWVEKQFGIPAADQTAFIKNETKNISQFLRNSLTDVLRSSIAMLAGLIITLVLTFLFLFHKEKYFSFFLKLTRGDTPKQKEE